MDSFVIIFINPAVGLEDDVVEASDSTQLMKLLYRIRIEEGCHVTVNGCIPYLYFSTCAAKARSLPPSGTRQYISPRFYGICRGV